MGTQSTWDTSSHKMVFSLPSKAAIEKDLPSKATLEADAGKVYLLAQHVQGLTHTSTPAECQTSLTAITDKLRGHLGVGALVSRGLETYGKDPVTYGSRSTSPWKAAHSKSGDLTTQKLVQCLFIAACLSRGLSTSLSWDTNL